MFSIECNGSDVCDARDGGRLLVFDAEELLCHDLLVEVGLLHLCCGHGHGWGDGGGGGGRGILETGTTVSASTSAAPICGGVWWGNVVQLHGSGEESITKKMFKDDEIETHSPAPIS